VAAICGEHGGRGDRDVRQVAAGHRESLRTCARPIFSSAPSRRIRSATTARFPGAGGYRTHIGSLYLCGSSSHPGGNITGLPGYKAAQVILADLGIHADWMPTPIAERLGAR
jgi:hypothetical protein